MNSPFPTSDNSGSNASRMGATSGTGSMGGSGSGGTPGASQNPSDMAKKAVDSASSTAHETVDRLAGSASRLADRLDEKARALTDAPMRAWEYSRTSVEQHPMQAIGVALLIGYLVGRLSAPTYTRY
ncbi:MAG: hypothetical protein V4731_10500 [Pseudomonadota bacterium]